MPFVGGCGGKSEPYEDWYSQLDDLAQFNAERKRLAAEAVKTSGNELTERKVTSEGTTVSQLQGINKAKGKMPETEGGESAYEAFIREYEKRTGKSWNGTVKKLGDALQRFTSELPSVPSLEANFSDELKRKTDGLVKNKDIEGLLKPIKQIEVKANELRTAIEKLGNALEAFRQSSSQLLAEVEALKGKSSEEARAQIDKLVAQTIPEVFKQLQEIENNRPAIEKVAERAAKLHEELRSIKDTATKEIEKFLQKYPDLPKEVRDELKSYQKEVEDFLAETALTMQAIAATAAMMAELLPLIAANPWVAAAVAAVLIILAVINGFGGGGGGDGDGDGTGNSSGTGQGEGKNPYEPQQIDGEENSISDKPIPGPSRLPGPEISPGQRQFDQQTKLGGGKDGFPYEAGFVGENYVFYIHEGDAPRKLEIKRGNAGVGEFFTQITEVENGQRNANVTIKIEAGAYEIQFDGLGSDDKSATLTWASGSYDDIEKITGYQE